MALPRRGAAAAPASFPPRVLREYSLLADGERGVLVGPLGEFSWMCAPRWDSPAVFSSLIGGSGTYAVTPMEERSVWGGYYEEGSLIWHSRWLCGQSIIECREALAFPARPHTAVVLRQVIAIQGEARVRVILDARAQFGVAPMRELGRQRGIWHGRTGGLHLRWSGGQRARRSGSALLLDIELDQGQHHDLVLEVSDRALVEAPVEADAAWEATRSTWEKTVPAFSSGLAVRDSRHAYAVLRGLTTAGGGMVAAATTSLPERGGSGRNYDYRYAWIRDQCFAGQATATHGPHPLLDDAVRFICERVLADGPNLRPAYRVDGSAVPSERRLTHLTGYPGGSDRIGNRVRDQFQLDALGEVLLLLAAAARGDSLDGTSWRAAEVAAAAIELRWRQPDAGIWELGDDRWTHSRLTCVAGLRALAEQAPAPQAAKWIGLADAILADAGSDCVHPSGRWQRSPRDGRVDAALLFPYVRGGLANDDPRSLLALEAVEAELVRDGYVYRFRQDERPLETAEGAFLLCGFLMALAVRRRGDDRESIAWFERTRASCGPPGLLTEEFDVRQRQLRGNLPQAFVHALLLDAAGQLAHPPG
ncbi:MAG: glycoside hydrolase family 15 protein [Candidatus Dormibacteria bacterium]